MGEIGHLLIVTTILWSGFEHVTSTEPSDVGNLTILAMLVSMMLMGATPKSLEICLIVAKQDSKGIERVWDSIADEIPVDAVRATAARITSFITSPQSAKRGLLCS